MIKEIARRINFNQHLVVSALVRLIVIVYGEFHDKYSEVPFTDIDYKVVTDGARHVIENGSPYQRHTYRYTPLLAYFLIPNVLVHKVFGKILFSLFDIFIGVLIRKIILDELHQTFCENANIILRKTARLDKRKSKATAAVLSLPPKYEQIATWSSLVWLYNPMAIVIATRGNGDAITSFFILLTIYAIHKALTSKETNSHFYTLMAGIVHGLAIHFRLYPFAFSLVYYIQLGNRNAGNKILPIWKSIIWPNSNQFILVVSTVATLVGLTWIFYIQYGYEFIYEAYLYHLYRKDTRHNFSLYFYMSYLNANPMFVEKILTFLPQLLLLLLISFQFGKNRKTLVFAIFLQAFVMVIFNPVITSQYFVWFLSILPICLKNLRGLFGLRRTIANAILWAGTQGIWLFSAYLLEFKGWNTFGFIWTNGLIFFCVNCFILKEIITNYDVVADFSK